MRYSTSLLSCAAAALLQSAHASPIPQDGYLSSLTSMLGFGSSGPPKPATPIIGGFMSSFLPRIKFDKSVDKTPELRQDAKRNVFRYGPIRIAGKNEPKPSSGPRSMDKYGQTFRGVVENGLCRNCTVLYGITGIQNEDGTKADEVYIHHFLALDISKREANALDRCPSSDSPIRDFLGGFIASRGRFMGAGFIGQGDDNGDSAIYFSPTEPNSTFKGGFHMGATDDIMIVADLVNYNEKSRDIYLTFDLEYLPGLVGQDATSELLSVGGCHLLAGPKVSAQGRTVSKSPEFIILEDGAIVSAKGHMHDGGEDMTLYVNGKQVCVSQAQYKILQNGAPGGINGMTRCGAEIPVKKGDKLVLESSYDLTKHPSRVDSHGEEAHGAMQGMDYMGMWALSFAVPGARAA